MQRNRAKRRLRAVARAIVLSPGTDVVVIARASAATCRFADLVQDVEALIAEATACRETEVSR